MNDTPRTIARYTVHFDGRVQGVGFRYTALEIAQSFAVAGYVRNLPDGRVELVVEGDASELDRFLDQLGQRMSRNITSRHVDKSDPTGEFGAPQANNFTIR